MARYEILANWKAAVGIPSTDSSKDALGGLLLDASSEAINNYTRRTFTPATATKVFYYVPAAPELNVDDLLSITSVTVGSTLLTTDQYEKYPPTLSDEYPHYMKLVRLEGGYPVAWGSQYATGPRKITIVGSWGYAATVPQPIQLACQIMAARLYNRHKVMYGNEGGMSEGGMSFVQAPKPSIDKDVETLLKPYRIARTVTVA